MASLIPLSVAAVHPNSGRPRNAVAMSTIQMNILRSARHWDLRFLAIASVYTDHGFFQCDSETGMEHGMKSSNPDGRISRPGASSKHRAWKDRWNDQFRSAGSSFR